MAEAEVIHVERWFVDAVEFLDEYDFVPSTKKESNCSNLAEEMHLPEETVQELAEVCNVSKLHKGGDDDDDDLVLNGIPQGGEKLLTLSLRKKRLEDPHKGNTTYRAKYRSLTWDYETAKPPDPDDPDAVMISAPEALLAVTVFQPDPKNRPVFDKELMVLGSQKLTELRDKILCVSDVATAGEFSQNPDLLSHIEEKSGDHYKSGYFFIENTFYNDTRHPTSVDYSQTVKDWAKEKGLAHWSSASSALMEETTFRDLQLVLGRPYLYCHQGDCEHILVFSDLRLIHQNDSFDLRQYPMVTSKRYWNSVTCNVCSNYTAKWVTHHDALAPTTPCFFCEACFRMLHYDVDGNKLAEFTAYPHLDPGIFN